MKEVILDRAEALHERLGTAGFVLSIIALCLALTGGAFAASKYVTKKEAEKIAKKQAKKYANSNPGAEGKPGAPGKDGANGTNGQDGAGKSVVIGNTAPGCAAGGKSVEVEGSPSTKQEICNGEEGEPGEPGEAGPTCPGGECLLPEGATQTGVWSFRTINVTRAWVSVQFPLKLSTAPGFHFITEEELGTQSAIDAGCPSTSTEIEAEEPKADAGAFCMYQQPSVGIVNAASFIPPRVTSSGVIAAFSLTDPATEARGYGVWAVSR